MAVAPCRLLACAAIASSETVGVLVVDKPPRLSSAAVVHQVKKALGAARAGHAGTLDPMATGVLVVCLGEATKIATWLLCDDKCYAGTVRLGEATDTADADGTVVDRASVPHRSADEVRAVIAGMVGTIEQTVPAFSALKREGRPLYWRARRGEAVERPSRTVRIDSFTLTRWAPPDLDFRVECGKGTYVRALAEDLARGLGTVGHLAALRRERSGPFGLDRAVGWEGLDRPDPSALESALVSPLEALAGLARRDLTAAEVVDVQHGRPLGADPAPPVGPVRLVTPDGRLLAIGEHREGRIWPLRVLSQGQSG